MRHFLIDGHDVMLQIPLYHAEAAKENREARESFIALVAEYALQNNIRSTIYFSGDKPSIKRAISAPVHVVYSGSRSVIDMIKDVIENSHQTTVYTLFTSDVELVRLASSRAHETHRSKHLANLLLSQDSTGSEKESESLSPSKVQFWLNIFNSRK